MNPTNTHFINQLATYLSESDYSSSDLVPILNDIYDAEKEGNLCVPIKENWLQTLNPIRLPFIVKSIDGVDHLYFDSVFTLKSKLETALKKQIHESHQINIDQRKCKEIQTKLEKIYNQSSPTPNGADPFSLKPGQERALQQLLNSNFQIISGGPGTGKTTVVAFLLRIMLELDILPDPEEIALVAPTGRAAQRLTESIQSNLKKMGSDQDFINLFHGQTVHSLLQFRKNEGTFRYNKDRSLPYRLILVDEVSMMDLKLMVSLFDALANIESNDHLPFRLIFLGDPNQLPSVDKGEVLADFLSVLEGEGKYISHLTESNRSKEGSKIHTLMKEIFPSQNATEQNEIPKISAIHKINSFLELDQVSDEVVWLNLNGKGSKEKPSRDLLIQSIWQNHFIPQMKNVSAWNFASESELSAFSPSEFLAELNRFRCLTIFRNGYFGIEGIHAKIENYALKFFHESSNPNLFRELASRLYYEGMPIIITKNDRSRKLFNGDVGFICRVKDELRAIFAINDKLFSFAIDTLPMHEAAYFMTVHKSQGSEYDSVLFYLPELKQTSGSKGSDQNNDQNKLLTRKILYTAITRAKKRVILAGSEATWQFGLKQNPKRVTGFSLVD